MQHSEVGVKEIGIIKEALSSPYSEDDSISPQAVISGSLYGS